MITQLLTALFLTGNPVLAQNEQPCVTLEQAVERNKVNNNVLPTEILTGVTLRAFLTAYHVSDDTVDIIAVYVSPFPDQKLVYLLGFDRGCAAGVVTMPVETYKNLREGRPA